MRPPRKQTVQKPKVDKSEPVDKTAKPNGAGPAKDKPAEVKPEDAKPEDPKPAEQPSLVLDLFGGGSTQTKAEPDKKVADAEKPVSKDGIPPATMDPDDLRKLTHIGPATARTLKAQGVTTYEQILKMKPDDLDNVLEKGGGQKLGKEKWEKAIADAKPLAEVSISNAANHFRKVPDVFDLPAITSTEPVRLTKLLIPANYLLTTELISPDGISPRRIFFELNKSSSADQTWTVAVKKTKSASKSTDIATFTKTFDSFNFAWLPEAAKEKSTVYLRNCLVKLSTPDGRGSTSKLRKPITVRSLRISEEDLSDTVKIELEGVPDFDRIQIQLGALRSKTRVIEVVDPSITLDSPALVALKHRENSGQFLTLQVFAERSGGGIKLTAGLVFNGGVLKNVGQLSAIQNQLEAAVYSAQQRLKAKKSDGELKKQVTAATGNLRRMEDYKRAIEWLFKGGGGIGEPINFDIAADFDDGRILLVKSNKNMVDEDKKKKK